MSEARNQRFEIDIDEIERQLRRSVEQPQAPKADPLAELARIVGQNDPFQGILTNGAPPRAAAEPANANHLPVPVAQPQRAPDPVVHEFSQHGHGQERADHGHAAAPTADHQDAYDPVVEAYGSHDDVLADEHYPPLRRRRSRGKLIAIVGCLAATVSAVAIGLAYRKSGGLLSTGAPPVIVADTSPLKVAPENPGGVEVPNQDRQIYAKAQQDGQSKVVDGREQPIDVRATTPAAPRGPASTERSSVSEALGEPRRVRTVAVNPDGTSYTAPRTPAANSAQGIIPTGNLPAPVSVQTVAVPNQPAPTVTPVAAQPVAQPPMASTHQALNVLPPRRPNLDGRPASTETPTRTASLPTAADAAKPAAAPKPKPAADAAKPTPEKPAAAAAGAKNFSVQIAVRPTEQEARAAWDQAQDKFGGALDNKPARLTSAQVAGKTVHRVRLGPMSKQEADAMCGRLKAKGGNCFVAQN